MTNDQPNIILIVFDTMRHDALGCYGGPTFTPNIDRFSNTSDRFTNAISPSPWTLPSHVSFFTGKYPSRHGIHETYDSKIETLLSKMNECTHTTITQMLADKGYNCIGLSANGVISNGSGFENNFNSFRDIDMLDGVDNEIAKILSDAGVENAANQAEAIKRIILSGKIVQLGMMGYNILKLKRRISSLGYPVEKGGSMIVSSLESSSFELPLFLFINMMEMHDPYTNKDSGVFFHKDSNSTMIPDLFGTDRIPIRVMRTIRTEYFRRAALADNYFGRIVKFLKKCNIYDNSLIIVTSDHGQALRERNFYGHGIFLYDELVRVPLIIKQPHMTINRVRNEYVSTCSIFDLISQAATGDGVFNIETSKFVVTEAYGIQHSTKMRPISDQKMLPVRRTIDVSRKAIYKDDYKISVDGVNGRIEEFSYKGMPLSPLDRRDQARNLLNDLQIFTGQEKFTIPDKL